jgi:hypothetical protein
MEQSTIAANADEKTEAQQWADAVLGLIQKDKYKPNFHYILTDANEAFKPEGDEFEEFEIDLPDGDIAIIGWPDNERVADDWHPELKMAKSEAKEIIGLLEMVSNGEVNAEGCYNMPANFAIDDVGEFYVPSLHPDREKSGRNFLNFDDIKWVVESWLLWPLALLSLTVADLMLIEEINWKDKAGLLLGLLVSTLDVMEYDHQAGLIDLTAENLLDDIEQGQTSQVSSALVSALRLEGNDNTMLDIHGLLKAAEPLLYKLMLDQQ